MRSKKEKIGSFILTFIMVILIAVTCQAHSERTDSSGGHKDNQNKSRLGSYHYHCGGYPAHLHTSGACPYSSGSKSSSSSNSKKSNSASITKETMKTTTQIEPVNTTVEVETIQISKGKTELEIGENIALQVDILPSNATNKEVIWKSSNESILTINTQGRAIAKAPGTAIITGSGKNGKVDSVEMTIKQPAKEVEETSQEDNKIMVPTSTESSLSKTEKSSSYLILGALGTVVIGGGGYLGYQKYKKR